MFANIVWPPKLANIPPCYVLSIQNIYGSFIFSHSLAKLANMPQVQKVGKHTPLQIWGAFHFLRLEGSLLGGVVLLQTRGVIEGAIRQVIAEDRVKGAVRSCG